MKPGPGYIESMDMDVALVRWPDGEDKRRELARVGGPRLLLVGPAVEPPLCLDPLEDWVRLPASPTEIRARAQALFGRIHRSEHPAIEDGSTVRFRSARIELPPLQGRLMAALIDRFGAVVSRERLTESAWPNGNPGRNNLDVHMVRLRRRLSAHGLEIRTVRSRGYLLTATDDRR